MTLDPEALFARARGGDAPAVIAELRAHVARAPEDFDGWLTLGLIAAEARDAELARTALGRAVELTPASLLARVAYARLLDPRRAHRQLGAALALAPEHAGIRHELALVDEELAVIRRRERALGNPAHAFLDRLSGDRVVDRPDAVVVRTESGGAVLFVTVHDGRIASLFFAIAELDALPPDLGARASITFLGQALALEPDEAADLLERLADAPLEDVGPPVDPCYLHGSLDAAGARIAFATRDVPTLGAMHGLLVTRLA